MLSLYRLIKTQDNFFSPFLSAAISSNQVLPSSLQCFGNRRRTVLCIPDQSVTSILSFLILTKAVTVRVFQLFLRFREGGILSLVDASQSLNGMCVHFLWLP
jgi:hypothetical protein